jgi:hypothetical protein
MSERGTALKLHKRSSLYGLVLVLMLIAVFVVVSACGGGDETPDATLAGGDEPVEGGTFNVYIAEPAFIDPVNLQESEGIQVGNQLFDSLVSV